MRGPIRLSELTPLRAAEVLRRTRRLLIPAGTMVPHGDHLPLGADCIVLERLTDDLSASLDLPRAPVIPFGVHSRTDPDAPGSASLTRKTLHRVMNELIAAWENEAKVTEVIILTAHVAEAHLEALSTIRALGRVSLVDIYGVPLDDLLGDQEPDAALLAWLAPDLIDPNRPLDGADPAMGERVFRRIVDHLTVHLAPPSSAEPGTVDLRPG